MIMSPRQLALDLPTRTAHGREDFFVSPSNEAAYGLVEQWPEWPDRRAVLIGPSGSGKTHLASIWAERAKAQWIEAPALAEAAVPALLADGAVLIENADRIGGAEIALFHLLNHAQETGACVLMTARAPPMQWGVSTPDLLSRLRVLPILAIEAPDDALLRSLLVKLFIDRQLVVDTSVIDYLGLHIERSFDAARGVVAALDREALSRGRRITRAMAAKLVVDAADPDASDT
jgi:chromosomal replication initiation ATPase DnaA